MTDVGPHALMVMIAREETEVPSLEEAAAVLRSLFGDRAEISVNGDDGVARAVVGPDELSVIPRPESLPWQLLENPCADAWYWPEASEVAKGHRSHITVVVRPSESPAVHRSLLLTRAVAGLLQAFGGSGVYWDSATMVHAPGVVLEAAREMAPRRLPLRLWVHFRVVNEDDDSDGAGKVSLFTTGLDALGEREIEIWGSEGKPEELVGWAYNTAHYLLSEDVTLENAQTVAVERDKFVHVFIKPSMFDPSREIYCLLLEK